MLEYDELDETYVYDSSQWYGSPSNRNTGLDNVLRCENGTFGEFLQATFPRHPERRVSDCQPQSRVLLPRGTSDPSYRLCVCADSTIDACAYP